MRSSQPFVRSLTIVLALLTLLTMAVRPRVASAETSVSFWGYYTAAQVVESNLGNFSNKEAFTDNYFGHWLDLFIDFKASEQVSVHWRMQLEGALPRWGSIGPNGRLGMITKHIYATIKQPWGSFNVGKLSSASNNYGLHHLGYHPISADWGLETRAAFDELGNVDGIEFDRTFDNGLGIYAQFSRLLGQGPSNVNAKDYDHDRYVIEPRYTWDNGGVSLGLIFDRDAGPQGLDWQGNLGHGNVDKTKSFFLNPALVLDFGALSLHGEAKIGWGRTRYYQAPAQKPIPSTSSVGQGYYLDLTYDYDLGNAILSGWYVSGSDMDSTANSKSLVSMGSEFYPLIIAFNWNGWGYNAKANINLNASGLANNAFANYIAAGRATVLSGGTPTEFPGAPVNAGDPVTLQPSERSATHNTGTESNNWGLSLSAHLNLTDKIALRGSIAYLRLVHPNYRVLNGYTIQNNNFGNLTYEAQSTDIGWEADIAVNFKLLDNIDLSSTFGYMMPGKAFNTLEGYEIAPVNAAGLRQARAVWTKAKDTFVWYNLMTVYF